MSKAATLSVTVAPVPAPADAITLVTGVALFELMRMSPQRLTYGADAIAHLTHFVSHTLEATSAELDELFTQEGDVWHVMIKGKRMASAASQTEAAKRAFIALVNHEDYYQHFQVFLQCTLTRVRSSYLNVKGLWMRCVSS